jgi:uncharacterized coiled-coil DUF342 family protein
LDTVREATEKRVQQLVGKRVRARGGFLDELLQGPQRQLDSLQQRIDTQVRQSVERVTSHPTFQKEIRRVESSIKRLEGRLSRLKTAPARAERRRKSAPRRRPKR